jgi:hypothetical protein
LIGKHSRITERALVAAEALHPDVMKVLTAWERQKLVKGSADADLVEGGLLPGSPYDSRFHFDTLEGYDAIRRNFQAIAEIAKRNLAKPLRDPWEFGKLLHSVQDFYSHSNHVPNYRAYRESLGQTSGSVPTLEEIALSPHQYPDIDQWLARLRTGHYPNPLLPDELKDHGWIIGPGQHKDTWQRKFHIEAMEAAERATTWYLLLYAKHPTTLSEFGRVWGQP